VVASEARAALGRGGGHGHRPQQKAVGAQAAGARPQRQVPRTRAP